MERGSGLQQSMIDALRHEPEGSSERPDRRMKAAPVVWLLTRRCALSAPRTSNDLTPKLLPMAKWRVRVRHMAGQQAQGACCHELQLLKTGDFHRPVPGSRWPAQLLATSSTRRFFARPPSSLLAATGLA